MATREDAAAERAGQSRGESNTLFGGTHRSPTRLDYQRINIVDLEPHRAQIQR